MPQQRRLVGAQQHGQHNSSLLLDEAKCITYAFAPLLAQVTVEKSFLQTTPLACAQTGSPLHEVSGSFATLQMHLLIDRVLLDAAWLKDMHAAHTGKCSLVKIGFPVSCSNY